MRIAQVAPLIESVPPKLYGGTERVVAYLTEELVRQGHDVTLFASGDSRTPARLVPCSRDGAAARPRRCATRCPTPCCSSRRCAGGPTEFDVAALPHRLPALPAVPRRSPTPTVTTLHGRLDLPDLHAALPRVPRRAAGLDLATPSARPMPPVQLGRHRPPRPAARPLPLRAGAARRLPRLPRPHLAGEAARPGDRDRRSAPASPLKIAAKVDRADERLLRGSEIEPLLDHPLVEFVGEIGDAEKRRSSATRWRCCSRSTGRSRSAW